MSSPTNFEAIESASNHAAHQAKGTDEADAQYLMASPRTKVSRLSRTDKDWCRLLEVCQILIADEQQVYDLNNLDDQLVLGIKGTLSVVELKVIRQRMLAGQEAKARRGELFKRLPIGYARDPVGKIMFHPDRRVCEAIQLVFAKFRELWSVRQTFQWFRDHDLKLPVNPIQGTRLIWKIPS
jgi:Resolvase, N terminal domain